MKPLIKGKQYYFSVAKKAFGTYIGYSFKSICKGRIFWFKPIKNDGFITSDNGNVGFSIGIGENVTFLEVAP